MCLLILGATTHPADPVSLFGHQMGPLDCPPAAQEFPLHIAATSVPGCVRPVSMAHTATLTAPVGSKAWLLEAWVRHVPRLAAAGCSCTGGLLHLVGGGILAV